MGVRRWSQEQIDTLVEMSLAGYEHVDIGKAIDKNPSAIRNYLMHNRKKLGIPPRKVRVRTNSARSKQGSEFDKEWFGSVPYLHWSITKAWRCQ